MYERKKKADGFLIETNENIRKKKQQHRGVN